MSDLAEAMQLIEQAAQHGAEALEALNAAAEEAKDE